MNIVALIPARAGSKRIPGKNTKLLGGKPLIQWTIEAAQQSGVFQEIHVSTDDDAIISAAYDCGVRCFHKRPDPRMSTDDAPDIRWVSSALEPFYFDAFAILRPTSPFRTAATIRRALEHFTGCQPSDSLRAVQLVREHPAKMWSLQTDYRLSPLYPYRMFTSDGLDVPWHSSPTQLLPRVYVQNASLEIAWRKTVIDGGSISGSNVLGFVTHDWEGFDINTPEDWERAEAHATEILARV